MLEGFPCYCQTFTADEQINFLKSLTLTPDYIINLKVSLFYNFFKLKLFF